MYSRKIALSLAKQYRKCPSPHITENPSQEQAWIKHLAICPYCSGKDRGSRTEWDTLAHDMKRMYPSDVKSEMDKDRPVRPGQFRFVQADPGVWRENYFYTPPMVLIIKRTASIPGAVLVSQIYHDIQMAAPGDLIVTTDDSPLGPLFVECWNTYTLKETLLGPSLATVPERVMDAALKCENHPEFCPQWGILPRPLVENDPRISFRELELEVAYTFSSQSVLELLEAFETPPLEQLFRSTARIRELIRTAVPGTGWKSLPRSFEEAFAMADLPAEHLPLAAADKIPNRTTANLVCMDADRVKSISPVIMELYGQSGSLMLSGRIHDLPKGLNNARFICFLKPESEPPISPIRCEWNEETGDFIIEFSYGRNITWHLKVAVVFETA